MPEEETIQFIVDEKQKRALNKLIDKGYTCKCVSCGKFYKEPPQEWYDDGHGGRNIDMCPCDSDLFTSLQDISCEIIEVKPVDNTIILKEHNFKHCKCPVGKIWKGDASTECWAELKPQEESEGVKIFKCLKSGLKIISLKSTEEELENAGFLRYPC